MLVRISRFEKEVAQCIEAEEGRLSIKLTINELLLQSVLKINTFFFRYVTHDHQLMPANKASIISFG